MVLKIHLCWARKIVDGINGISYKKRLLLKCINGEIKEVDINMTYLGIIV